MQHFHVFCKTIPVEGKPFRPPLVCEEKDVLPTGGEGISPSLYLDKWRSGTRSNGASEQSSSHGIEQFFDWGMGTWDIYIYRQRQGAIRVGDLSVCNASLVPSP